jgi:predicted Zn-dependent protease
MMVKRTLIAAAVTLVTAGGCATPQYMSQTVDSKAVSSAGSEIRNADNWVPRYLTDEEAEKKILEVYARLLPGATQICRDMDEHKCAWDIRYSPDDDVNAFAAGEGVILIKKGILRHADNDDELAMVIAHEMSHHAADHISETRQNATTGAMVGAVLMGALAGTAYSGTAYSPAYNQYRINEAVNSGMQAGAALGHLSFSKGQENEADYLAAHILHRAGYDLTKARGMWVKLGRLGTTEHGERHSLNTHPDPAERLARWDVTTEEVRNSNGALTKPAPAERASRSGETGQPVLGPG